MTAPVHHLVPPVPPLRVGPRSDGGDALWIDPERAQGVIDKLSQVAKNVRAMADKCHPAHVQPSAADEISRNVAAQANLMADNARAFCLAWSAQLDGAAARLDEQLRAYQATEEDNRRRMT